MGKSHSWNVLNLVNYVATNYGVNIFYMKSTFHGTTGAW